jgi:hypothetical protein
MNTERVHPFSNTSEYMCWTARNCERCAKSYDQNGENFACDIDQALTLACFDGGEVDREIYSRMGGRSGKCLEFLPTGPAAGRRADLPGQLKMF